MTNEPHTHWNQVTVDDKHTTWRCRGCKALAVTGGTQHPGKCLRCVSKGKKP